MFSSVMLCLAFAIGFVFESMFGFGGGIIAYSILAVFFDIKKIVIVGLYVGTLASFAIAITSRRSINFKAALQGFVIAIGGVVAGVLFFKILPSKTLLRLYSVTLIIISLRALLFKEIVFDGARAKIAMFIGGIIQGSLGVGGPFFLLGLKSQVKDKTAFRATIALLFFMINMFRYAQLQIMGLSKWNFFVPFWYVVLPVLGALFVGYKFHKKIPQNKFDTYIYLGILTSAIAFLVIF